MMIPILIPLSLTTNQDDLNKTIEGMLMKIQEIAEKIQKNTSKMIVDNEFLSQEEVAEMVLTLSDDTISKLINGRVIPNDRVFYPVKPIVGTSIDDNNIQNLKEKVVVITTTSSKEKDVQRITSLANRLNDSGVRQVNNTSVKTMVTIQNFIKIFIVILWTSQTKNK